MTDTIFDLAAALGFQDLAIAEKLRRPALADAVQSPVTFTGEPSTTPVVAADSEGRAGVAPGSGAVPSMPRPPSLRFPLDRVRAQGLRRLLDRNPLPPGRW